MDERPAWQAEAEKKNKREGASLAFFLLMALLLLLLLRPQDLIPRADLLHLALIISLLCMLTHILMPPGPRKAIFVLSPPAKLFVAISIWALATAPLSFWITGVVNTFFNNWVKMVFLFLLLGNAVRTIKQLRQTIRLCVLSVAVVSLIAIAIRAIEGPSTPSGRLEALVSGPYSGSNYLAITVLIVLGYALYSFLLEPKPLIRLFYGGIAVLFAIAVLLTQSRAGALALFVILAGVLWQLRRWKRNLLPIAGAMFLVLLPALLLFGKGMTQRFSTVFEDYDLQNLNLNRPLRMALGSYQERLNILGRSLQITLEHPITGVGMGDFSAADARSFFTGSGRDWLGPHNTYLQVASEMGLVGLAMYLLLLWLVIKRLRQARSRISAVMSDNPELRQLAMFCDATTIGLCGYLITSAFASVAYNSYLFLLAGLAEVIANLASGLPEPAKKEAPQEMSVWWPDFVPTKHEALR